MIKLLCKWCGRSSALLLIKVCYTVKAVCHRGPCESAQSLVTPLGIHQRFLMGGMVSLELNLFWRAQCTGQLLQPSPCTVHFGGNRWTVTAKRRASRCCTCFMTKLEVLWCSVQVGIKTKTTPGDDTQPPSRMRTLHVPTAYYAIHHSDLLDFTHYDYMVAHKIENTEHHCEVFNLRESSQRPRFLMQCVLLSTAGSWTNSEYKIQNFDATGRETVTNKGLTTR